MLIKHKENIYKVWWKHQHHEYSRVFRDTVVKNGETVCFVQLTSEVEGKLIADGSMYCGVAKVFEKDQYVKKIGRKLSFHRCILSIMGFTSADRQVFFEQYREQLPKDFE